MRRSGLKCKGRVKFMKVDVIYDLRPALKKRKCTSLMSFVSLLSSYLIQNQLWDFQLTNVGKRDSLFDNNARLYNRQNACISVLFISFSSKSIIFDSMICLPYVLYAHMIHLWPQTR